MQPAMSYKVALSFADGKTLFCQVASSEILLDAALRSGINIPLDCREGVCGTCQGRCESGEYSLDYVDEEALTAQDLAQRKVLTCQTRVSSDAAFSFDFDSTLCQATQAQPVPALVSALEQVSPTTAILHLDAGAAPGPLQFLPGQYARLQVPGTDQWRAYSFANRPNPENHLRFLIRLLPKGLMSDFLRERCQIGMTINLEAPLGSFYLRQVERPLLLVAGGTGLSAFLGMLDEMADKGGCGQPVQLFYGVNQEADLCEQQRLESYRASIPDFDYQPVVNQPPPFWQGLQGYIPDHFDRQRLAQAAPDIYLCGPPPMVDAVKNWLKQEGLEHLRLYSEKFLKS